MITIYFVLYSHYITYGMCEGGILTEFYRAPPPPPVLKFLDPPLKDAVHPGMLKPSACMYAIYKVLLSQLCYIENENHRSTVIVMLSLFRPR